VLSTDVRGGQSLFDNVVKLKPNTQYTLSTSIATGLRVYSVGADAPISADSNVSTITFTTTSNDSYVFKFVETSGFPKNIGNIQLELGSVATSYESYQKANLLLQGFAGTPASGYAPVVCKNIGQDGSYTNLVTNGDFSQGTTGWSGTASTLSATNNILSVNGNGSGANPSATQTFQGRTRDGSRWFIEKKARVTNSVCASIRFVIAGDSTSIISNPVQNQWYNILSIVTIPNDGAAFINDLQHRYADATTANGKVMEVQEAMAINLTDNPLVQYLEAQLGRQLTVAECDYLFTFTASTASLKAKTVPFLKFDGTNDYGIANHPSLDITGTGDFAIECVFKTDASLANGYILYSGNGTSFLAYGMYAYFDGKLEINCQNSGQLVNNSLPCLTANSLYTLLYYRKSGVLKCRLNKVQNFNAANANSLISSPYFRVGAKTSNGTAHDSFANIFLGHLSITNGALQPFTEAELISKFDKFTMQTFGI
jgi:hypothetical protein